MPEYYISINQNHRSIYKVAAVSGELAEQIAYSQFTAGIKPIDVQYGECEIDNDTEAQQEAEERV